MSEQIRTMRRPTLVLSAILALVLTACGSDSAASSETSNAGTIESPQGEPLGNPDIAEPDPPDFDPANFVDPLLDTNPYHPLRPGLQWVRGGTTEIGSRTVPFQVITTMTDVVRDIEGVPAVAMLDESSDSGGIIQLSVDYMALDKDGNVWVVGGYTEDYEGGEFTTTDTVWLGTLDGGVPGILMPAEVDLDTPPYFIGAGPEEDPSIGAVVEIGVSECVEFGCYDDVRIIQEGEVGAPDNENKHYAPGVGVINNVPLDASLHQDRFQLQNLVELSAVGLAEVSQTVLDLETHAQETEPETFGSAIGSRQLG